jgi:small subunit ribosomal protein S6
MLTTGPPPPANGARGLCICPIRRCAEVRLHEYELVVVMNPEIPEEDVQSAIDRVTSAVTTRGGSVDEVQPWGRRKLAYPIRRHMEGNYILTNIKLDPERAHDLESSFMISEDILRHLLIRKDEA